MILYIILMGWLWCLGYSVDILFGFVMIVCCGGILMFALASYQNTHLTEQLEQKEQECAGHKEIIVQGEQRLFAKTQKVLQEWLKQWDEGAKQWERDVLGIKNPGHWPPSKFSG
ncbi:hypothetical protein [Bartonella grahamii]|uniref:hypothetical protein n=2 Tax=Bartonella grahamii TaxID=33045 RepID=UPI002E7BD8ED|nr:hypothetical protein [Bartonella grahamii]